MERDKNELIIHVMHGYDSLKSPNDVDCFGCYIVGDYEIYVADNVPTDQLFHTIAHEYMHYLQDIEGREQNEDEANAFGFSVFTPCYRQGIADERAKVFELITQRLQMPCDIEFCDDCEECCEVSALMWLDEQLHEQLKERNNG